jgi:predicted enzyme related to lactoylglutathione lyase
MSTSTNPQEAHQKPPPGAPAWIRIPATSVARAQKFYETVFGWKFMDHQDRGYAPDKLSIFRVPGSPTLMGGIGKVEDEEGGEKGKGDGKVITLYLMVENVEECLVRVEKEGGVVSKGMWVEGGHTELGEFRDTEGNLVGVLRWLI